MSKSSNEPWKCCDSFRAMENADVIIITDKGYCVTDGEFLASGSDAVLFDIAYCPFCGTKVPQIKGPTQAELEAHYRSLSEEYGGAL